jgi:hypothetical protein
MSKREQLLFALRSGIVPSGYKPQLHMTIESVCSELGAFWIARKSLAKVPIGLKTAPIYEYTWFCDCSVVASNGVVLQFVRCDTHNPNSEE